MFLSPASSVQLNQEELSALLGISLTIGEAAEGTTGEAAAPRLGRYPRASCIFNDYR